MQSKLHNKRNERQRNKNEKDWKRSGKCWTNWRIRSYRTEKGRRRRRRCSVCVCVCRTARPILAPRQGKKTDWLWQAKHAKEMMKQTLNISRDKNFHSFSLRVKLSGHISHSKEIKKIVCIKWRFFRRSLLVFKGYYSYFDLIFFLILCILLPTSIPLLFFFLLMYKPCAIFWCVYCFGVLRCVGLSRKATIKFTE